MFFQGQHALVYDINTARETWEWVDIKEVCFSFAFFFCVKVFSASLMRSHLFRTVVFKFQRVNYGI